MTKGIPCWGERLAFVLAEVDLDRRRVSFPCDGSSYLIDLAIHYGFLIISLLFEFRRSLFELGFTVRFSTSKYTKRKAPR